MADETRTNPAPAVDPRVGRASATAPASSGPNPAPNDAFNSALDEFVQAHMTNNSLSQNTGLYNEAQDHIRALREIASRVA